MLDKYMKMRFSINMSTELAKRMDEELRAALLDVQGYATPVSLARQNPEKWLEIASRRLQGESMKSIMEDLGGHYDTYKMVDSQIGASPVLGNLKRELAVRHVATLKATIDLNERVGEVLARKLDGMTEEELEKTSALDLARMKRELSTANKLDTDAYLRMSGDNVQKIEVTHKKLSYDEIMSALRQAQGVIDVEDTDDI